MPHGQCRGIGHPHRPAPRFVPRLRRHRCVTDVLNEHPRLTDRSSGRMLPRTIGSSWTAAGRASIEFPSGTGELPRLPSGPSHRTESHHHAVPCTHRSRSQGPSRPAETARRIINAHAFTNPPYHHHSAVGVHPTSPPTTRRIHPPLLQHQRLPQLPRPGRGRPRGHLSDLRVPPPPRLTSARADRPGLRNTDPRSAAMPDDQMRPIRIGETACRALTGAASRP